MHWRKHQIQYLRAYWSLRLCGTAAEMSWKFISIHPGIYWNILEFYFFITVRTLYRWRPRFMIIWNRHDATDCHVHTYICILMLNSYLYQPLFKFLWTVASLSSYLRNRFRITIGRYKPYSNQWTVSVDWHVTSCLRICIDTSQTSPNRRYFFEKNHWHFTIN